MGETTLTLRPYQEDAADFLFGHDRAMILAPVGAGKTAITLTAMTEMIAEGHVKRWLVLAPKRVCTEVWPVEQPKWALDFDIAIAVGSPKARRAAFASDAPIVVINYDNIQSLTEDDLAQFDGIVFDELTRMKNPSGKRFKALLKQIDRFQFRWGLTGSFTSNGLEDVFGQCKIIDQSLLGRSKGAFLQRYFACINRDFGEWAPVKGSLEKVMEAIRPATFVLEPGVYADKLPPLHVLEMRCDMADRAPYEKMKRDFMLELGTDAVIAANAAAVTNKLQQLASGFVYNTKTTASDRPGKFDTKQGWNLGQISMLLIHPKSAGHGLNLQHGGNKIIFLSLPWSLELYEQTIGRLHRGGQTCEVWCYLLICNKTIDERIWGALQDKRTISNIALEELKA